MFCVLGCGMLRLGFAEWLLQMCNIIAVTTSIHTDLSSHRERSVQCTGPSITNISSQIFTTVFSEVGIVSKVIKSYGNVYVEFAKEESVQKVSTVFATMIKMILNEYFYIN